MFYFYIKKSKDTTNKATETKTLITLMAKGFEPYSIINFIFAVKKKKILNL